MIASQGHISKAHEAEIYGYSSGMHMLATENFFCFRLPALSQRSKSF
jgi:hypothetical protein